MRWLLLLLLLPLASASHPDLAVLIYHPFPDSADELGVDAGGLDPFTKRYGFLGENFLDYPATVIDGTQPFLGLLDPPYIGTKEAYTQALESSQAKETPATITAQADRSSYSLTVEPKQEFQSHVRVAVVEDHVEYKPPPALSNGVTNHRFTVREYTDYGVTLFDQTVMVNGTISGSYEGPLFVAVWLQNTAQENRFLSNEVLQSIMVPTDGESHQAEDKIVLIEMLSATWCDTCLIGDLIVEELAADYGFSSEPPTSGYYTGTPTYVFVLAIVGGAIMLVMPWRSRG